MAVRNDEVVESENIVAQLFAMTKWTVVEYFVAALITGVRRKVLCLVT